MIDRASSYSDFAELIGQEIVVDLASPFVCLGTLTAVQAGFLQLAQVDMHDLRDSKTSRELYVLESRQHGIRANRQQLWLNLRDVVGLSLLSDVVT